MTTEEILVKRCNGLIAKAYRQKKKILKLALKHPDNSEVQAFKKMMLG